MIRMHHTTVHESSLCQPNKLQSSVDPKFSLAQTIRMTLENQNSRFGRRTSFEVRLPPQMGADDYHPPPNHESKTKLGRLHLSFISSTCPARLEEGWPAHGRVFRHFVIVSSPSHPLTPSALPPLSLFCHYPVCN
jgi:hypothetical protein